MHIIVIMQAIYSLVLINQNLKLFYCVNSIAIEKHSVFE